MLSTLYTLPGDRRRYRALSRRKLEQREAPRGDAYETVTVREARPTDFEALVRLAALDSKRLPDGRLVVAEVDGRLLAAVPVRGGEAIADPFEYTANLVMLLELRAAQLRALEGDRLGGTSAPAARRCLVARPADG